MIESQFQPFKTATINQSPTQLVPPQKNFAQVNQNLQEALSLNQEILFSQSVNNLHSPNREAKINKNNLKRTQSNQIFNSPPQKQQERSHNPHKPSPFNIQYPQLLGERRKTEKNDEKQIMSEYNLEYGSSVSKSTSGFSTSNHRRTISIPDGLLEKKNTPFQLSQQQASENQNSLQGKINLDVFNEYFESPYQLNGLQQSESSTALQRRLFQIDAEEYSIKQNFKKLNFEFENLLKEDDQQKNQKHKSRIEKEKILSSVATGGAGSSAVNVNDDYESSSNVFLRPIFQQNQTEKIVPQQINTSYFFGNSPSLSPLSRSEVPTVPLNLFQQQKVQSKKSSYNEISHESTNTLRQQKQEHHAPEDDAFQFIKKTPTNKNIKANEDDQQFQKGLKIRIQQKTDLKEANNQINKDDSIVRVQAEPENKEHQKPIKNPNQQRKINFFIPCEDGEQSQFNSNNNQAAISKIQNKENLNINENFPYSNQPHGANQNEANHILPLNKPVGNLVTNQLITPSQTFGNQVEASQIISSYKPRDTRIMEIQALLEGFTKSLNKETPEKQQISPIANGTQNTKKDYFVEADIDKITNYLKKVNTERKQIENGIGDIVKLQKPISMIFQQLNKNEPFTNLFQPQPAPVPVVEPENRKSQSPVNQTKLQFLQKPTQIDKLFNEDYSNVRTLQNQRGFFNEQRSINNQLKASVFSSLNETEKMNSRYYSATNINRCISTPGDSFSNSNNSPQFRSSKITPTISPHHSQIQNFTVGPTNLQQNSMPNLNKYLQTTERNGRNIPKRSVNPQSVFSAKMRQPVNQFIRENASIDYFD